MAESLPRELVDAIIDEVHSPRNLKAFSLTCRAFSLPTRAILFRQIELTQSQLDPDVVQRFHELYVVSPHIPPLVQTLHIDGRRRSPTFLAVFDIVSWVLQFMQNLKVIKLYHVTIGNWIAGTVSSHSFREIQHLAEILELTSGTLRVLLLNLSPWRSHFLNELPLIRIGHLRQIAFITMSRVHGLQCLQWWIQSLRRVTQSNPTPALQVMDIKLDTLYRWDPVLSEWPWSELDQIFSSPPFDKRF